MSANNAYTPTAFGVLPVVLLVAFVTGRRDIDPYGFDKNSLFISRHLIIYPSP